MSIFHERRKSTRILRCGATSCLSFKSFKSFRNVAGDGVGDREGDMVTMTDAPYRGAECGSNNRSAEIQSAVGKAFTAFVRLILSFHK